MPARNKSLRELYVEQGIVRADNKARYRSDIETFLDFLRRDAFQINKYTVTVLDSGTLHVHLSSEDLLEDLRESL